VFIKDFIGNKLFKDIVKNTTLNGILKKQIDISSGKCSLFKYYFYEGLFEGEGIYFTVSAKN